MKIYNVIIEDCHTDTTVHPFSTPERAMSEAKRAAEELSGYNFNHYEEEIVDGWLFYAICSSEDDSVRVVEAELDKEIE